VTKNSKCFCVVGDGQLARYLCQSARARNLKTIIVGRTSSPAAAFADEVISDVSQIKGSAEEVVVTFENEFLDIAAVSEELEKLALDCKPDLKAISVLREKRKQKLCLEGLGIQSPNYINWGKGDVDQFLRKVATEFPKDAVIKWSTGGYDSKGVYFFGPGTTIQAAANFCEEARSKGHEVFAEEKISFDRELALVGSRDDRGNFRFLPLVETWQEEGICRLVKSHQASPEQLAEARGICEAIMSEWDYVGVLAVEFFVSRKGELFVNEIAPRVHNSGHFSLLASEHSQFDLHVAAVCDLPLKPNKHASFFAMWNILGPNYIETFRLRTPPDENEVIADGVKLFWYDKEEVKARRKMGHLCAVADSEDELSDKINVMKRWEEIFWANNCSR